MQNRLPEAQMAFRNAMVLDPYNSDYPKYLDLVSQMMRSSLNKNPLKTK